MSQLNSLAGHISRLDDAYRPDWARLTTSAASSVNSDVTLTFNSGTDATTFCTEMANLGINLTANDNHVTVPKVGDQQEKIANAFLAVFFASRLNHFLYPLGITVNSHDVVVASNHLQLTFNTNHKNLTRCLADEINDIVSLAAGRPAVTTNPNIPNNTVTLSFNLDNSLQESYNELFNTQQDWNDGRAITLDLQYDYGIQELHALQHAFGNAVTNGKITSIPTGTLTLMAQGVNQPALKMLTADFANTAEANAFLQALNASNKFNVRYDTSVSPTKLTITLQDHQPISELTDVVNQYYTAGITTSTNIIPTTPTPPNPTSSKKWLEKPLLSFLFNTAFYFFTLPFLPIMVVLSGLTDKQDELKHNKDNSLKDRLAYLSLHSYFWKHMGERWGEETEVNTGTKSSSHISSGLARLYQLLSFPIDLIVSSVFFIPRNLFGFDDDGSAERKTKTWLTRLWLPSLGAWSLTTGIMAIIWLSNGGWWNKEPAGNSFDMMYEYMLEPLVIAGNGIVSGLEYFFTGEAFVDFYWEFLAKDLAINGIYEGFILELGTEKAILPLAITGFLILMGIIIYYSSIKNNGKLKQYYDNTARPALENFYQNRIQPLLTQDGSIKLATGVGIAGITALLAITLTAASGTDVGVFNGTAALITTIALATIASLAFAAAIAKHVYDNNLHKDQKELTGVSLVSSAVMLLGLIGMTPAISNMGYASGSVLVALGAIAIAVTYYLDKNDYFKERLPVQTPAGQASPATSSTGANITTSAAATPPSPNASAAIVPIGAASTQGSSNAGSPAASGQQAQTTFQPNANYIYNLAKNNPNNTAGITFSSTVVSILSIAAASCFDDGDLEAAVGLAVTAVAVSAIAGTFGYLGPNKRATTKQYIQTRPSAIASGAKDAWDNSHITRDMKDKWDNSHVTRDMKDKWDNSHITRDMKDKWDNSHITRDMKDKWDNSHITRDTWNKMRGKGPARQVP